MTLGVTANVDELNIVPVSHVCYVLDLSLARPDLQAIDGQHGVLLIALASWHRGNLCTV